MMPYNVKQDWQSGEWQVINSHMEVVATFPNEADAHTWCMIKNRRLAVINKATESNWERSEA